MTTIFVNNFLRNVLVIFMPIYTNWNTVLVPSRCWHNVWAIGCAVENAIPRHRHFLLMIPCNICLYDCFSSNQKVKKAVSHPLNMACYKIFPMLEWGAASRKLPIELSMRVVVSRKITTSSYMLLFSNNTYTPFIHISTTYLNNTDTNFQPKKGIECFRWIFDGIKAVVHNYKTFLRSILINNMAKATSGYFINIVGFFDFSV